VVTTDDAYPWIVGVVVSKVGSDMGEHADAR